MPLTAAQICTLSRQIAKAPNYLNQSGQLLNLILAELCQEYDLDVAKKVYNFNLTPATAAVGNLNAQLASGPFALPPDYLRAKIGDIFYYPNGIGAASQGLTPIDLAEFDGLAHEAGFQSLPIYWTTDLATPTGAIWGSVDWGAFDWGDDDDQRRRVAYVWPPASGSYPCMVRYYSQMDDILTPETSVVVPWFPNQQFLITELAGRIMQVTGDNRWQSFLSDNETTNPAGARVLLRRYLALKDDTSNRAQTVRLNPRRFGGGWDRLPRSKAYGGF